MSNQSLHKEGKKSMKKWRNGDCWKTTLT